MLRLANKNDFDAAVVIQQIAPKLPPRVVLLHSQFGFRSRES
jgi:hypothetical protein